jgi:hypothetical protein
MFEIVPGLFCGWARTHISGRCGCTKKFYRVHLVFIGKYNGEYRLVGVSEALDFGLKGTEYLVTPVCRRRDRSLNAVIATAIHSWCGGIMTLLLYRQDRDRIVVRVHGLDSIVARFLDSPQNAGAGLDAQGMSTAVKSSRKACVRYLQQFGRL